MAGELEAEVLLVPRHAAVRLDAERLEEALRVVAPAVGLVVGGVDGVEGPRGHAAVTLLGAGDGQLELAVELAYVLHPERRAAAGLPRAAAWQRARSRAGALPGEQGADRSGHAAPRHHEPIQELVSRRGCVSQGAFANAACFFAMGPKVSAAHGC